MNKRKDRKFINLVNRAASGLRRILDRDLLDLGLGSEHVLVLLSLEKCHALTLAELTSMVKMEDVSMTKLLVRMERDGVELGELESEKMRRSLIAVAPVVLRPLQGALTDASVEEALAGFSEGETEALIALLRRLITNVERVRDSRLQA
jgi:DNA-binding MarR family transcriptional regulator